MKYEYDFQLSGQLREIWLATTNIQPVHNWAVTYAKSLRVYVGASG